jgi:hypothetical protein
MPGNATYDYAVIRVVPHIDRGEFINAGVVLFCRTKRFLAAAIDLDEERLHVLAPNLDMELVREQLEIIPRICAGEGPVGALGRAEAFHWVTAPHSTIIQASPVHSGYCDDPAATLEHLVQRLVRRVAVDGPPAPDGGWAAESEPPTERAEP